MARIMKMESRLDRAMSNWLKELYMSGLDSTIMLKMFPIKPMIPENKTNS